MARRTPIFRRDMESTPDVPSVEKILSAAGEITRSESTKKQYDCSIKRLILDLKDLYPETFDEMVGSNGLLKKTLPLHVYKELIRQVNMKYVPGRDEKVMVSQSCFAGHATAIKYWHEISDAGKAADNSEVIRLTSEHLNFFAKFSKERKRLITVKKVAAAAEEELNSKKKEEAEEAKYQPSEKEENIILRMVIANQEAMMKRIVDRYILDFNAINFGINQVLQMIESHSNSSNRTDAVSGSTVIEFGSNSSTESVLNQPTQVEPTPEFLKFDWGNSTHHIPENFCMPRITSVALWIYWVFGNLTDRIRPLRFAESRSFIDKNEKVKHCKAKFVMDYIQKESGMSYEEIHGLGVEGAEKLFRRIYSGLLKDTDFERLKYSTAYFHLQNLKKKENNNQ